MGKVLVIGKAEKKIMPDCCDISISVESRKNQPTAATKEANGQCELLLSKLQDNGFDLKKIEIIYDRLSIEREYQSDRRLFQSRKTMRIHIPSDSMIINKIKNILEEGITGISYGIEYSVSNEANYHKQLLREAIADSRRKADFLAESVGQKIVGIDTANLSGDEDVYDLTDDVDVERHMRETRLFGAMAEGSGYPLSDNLKPEEIELNAEVKIVWLLDSDQS